MDISDRQFQRLVISALMIGFAALLAAGITAAWAVLRNQEYGRLVAHTHVVQQQIGEYSTLTERGETARRGYLLNPDTRFLRTYRATSQKLPSLLTQLRMLTADNPNQTRRLRNVEVLASELRDAGGRAVERRGRATTGVGAAELDRTANLVRQIRTTLGDMNNEEGRLLAARASDQTRSGQILLMVLLVAGLLIVATATGSVLLILRYTRDLDRSRLDLRALNENLEDAVVERTTDLQRANAEIQRFAYIVSHDLRSPLVNVMGYTSELEAALGPIGGLLERAETEDPDMVRPEARAAVREDLPEAIGFIRASTQKMDRLINAILKLSREGRRVMSPRPLDMTQLVEGIRDSLQHPLNEANAELVIERPLPSITSDQLAIEQIFSNLIENASKYLKPGAAGRIVVRGRRQGPRAMFEVEDNGRGIDPKDHERIFDLFRRSGPQDRAGEGIGLAHVRALAHRLGGTVTCESELGRGAIFRVSLPTHFIAAEGSSQ